MFRELSQPTAEVAWLVTHRGEGSPSAILVGAIHTVTGSRHPHYPRILYLSHLHQTIHLNIYVFSRKGEEDLKEHH